MRYHEWKQIAPKGKKGGGLTVIQKINGQYIVLMGKNWRGEYEFMGGGAETYDKTGLHTCIREYIEESMNKKMKPEEIHEIVKYLINNKYIKHSLTKEGKENITYFTDFNGLEKIWNYVHTGSFSGDLKNPFNLSRYISTRKIEGKPSNGLNEIKILSLHYLRDVERMKLRPVSQNIYEYLKNKLN